MAHRQRGREREGVGGRGRAEATYTAKEGHSRLQCMVEVEEGACRR